MQARKILLAKRQKERGPLLQASLSWRTILQGEGVHGPRIHIFQADGEHIPLFVVERFNAVLGNHLVAGGHIDDCLLYTSGGRRGGGDMAAGGRRIGRRPGCRRMGLRQGGKVKWAGRKLGGKVERMGRKQCGDVRGIGL